VSSITPFTIRRGGWSYHLLFSLDLCPIFISARLPFHFGRLIRELDILALGFAALALVVIPPVAW
jgi:hypothetical protein